MMHLYRVLCRFGLSRLGDLLDSLQRRVVIFISLAHLGQVRTDACQLHLM